MKKFYVNAEAFPNSVTEPFEITSPSSGQYNCIAWAMEDTRFFYWPVHDAFLNRPANIARKVNLHSFSQLFASIGYEPCASGDLEPGYQKIALFANKEVPTHAARQLPNGMWTSKLGADVDVCHTLNAMEGGRYGNVRQFYRREIIG